MSTELTFSIWLRERRNKLGVTQEELSEHLGFSPAMLRKLESGERRPSGQIASLVATYFSVPADEREAFIAFARTGRGASTDRETAPGLASTLPPWRGVYVRRTNLPAVLTPLIGREQEEEAARDLLLNPKTRMLTLTGTAGIGKTRLALQVASGLLEQFEEGIYFVDLAPILDPDAVLQAVAHTLGLKEESERSLEATERALVEYVRERRMLLVLDNFEQVLDAASSLVRLMQASPWIKVLVTSREALHVRGERRFSVPPLDLPNLEHLPPLELLARCPSIELFLERAQGVAPDFTLNQGNARNIAAVCVGLEGLPLAIELAASRANHVSPADMTRALSSQLELLTGGARDFSARHRTLRAAIEWSYKLLDQSEQRLFRHLGVFLGGFTSEAIDAIYENQPGSSRSTLDTLASLTDKSLVRRQREVAGSGETRLGLLEAVREYAIEQADELGEAGWMRDRHADYYLSLADQAEEHFRGPQYSAWGAEQTRWIDRLETDIDNLRVALDWYEVQARGETKDQTEKGAESKAGAFDLEKGLRLAGDLRRIWFGRGYVAEGSQRLRAFLARVPTPLPAEPPGLRASYAFALLVLGRLTSSQAAQDDVTPARSLVEEALRIVTELDDKQLAANALLVLGALTLAQGDHQAARSFYGQCLDTYRELGNSWGAGAALDELGTIELDQGNFTLAHSLFEESVALYKTVGETFGAASAHRNLGLVAYYEKDYGAAYAFWEESLQLRKELGETSSVSRSLVLLGMAAARQGDHVSAGSLLREGLLLAQQVRSAFSAYQALTGFGVLESLQNNAERSATLFGAAEALRQAAYIQLSPSHQAELAAEVLASRTGLQEDLWNEAWTLGNSMTLEETIAYLLSNDAG